MSTPPPPKPSRLSSWSSFSSRSAKDVTPPAGEQIEVDQDQLMVPSEGADSEAGKFRQLLGILKKALHVSDLAAVRLSLPANLLEPIGNLEYWQYCERPDFFSAMNEADDELDRMLGVLRWVFTKDLKFVKAKIAKPYNSILGEHFHCHYDCDPVSLHPVHGTPEVSLWLDENPAPEVLQAAGRTSLSTASSTASLALSSKSPSVKKANSSKSSSTTTLPLPHSASSSSISNSNSTYTTPASSVARSEGGRSTRVVFLNEQTCHHPPISYFLLESRGPKGTVRAIGADQLSAKFTGTNIKVFPGPHNHGIFITLPDRENEEYQVTHPTATVAGLLRGSPYATIGEQCYITRRGGVKGQKHLRCIIGYIEESWLTKPKFLVEGVIYVYDPDSSAPEYTKIKQVPADKVVATLEGCWRGEIRWKRPGERSSTLVDLLPLAVAPKKVAPISTQDPLETRKVWNDVTTRLISKDWAGASKAKQTLEQIQRDKAKERERKGEDYKPRYFWIKEDEEKEDEDTEWDGRPRLTKEGWESVEKEFVANHPA